MISLASRLKRRSPSVAYDNGWIMGENGKPWHPSNSQKQLLHGLTNKRKPAGFMARLFRG
ncbi:phage filamentation protein Fil family protein [Pantoea ananatis]